MQVEHGIISLSNMWKLYTKLSSWVMAQYAHFVNVAGDLDFSKGKAVHSRRPRSW